MVFTPKSKIAQAWKNPLGQDVLQFIMRLTGHKEQLPQRSLFAGLPLSVLDRLVGKGFADAFVDMLNSMTGYATITPNDDPAWWKGCVIYHIYLPSFMDSDHDGVGDLRGAMQRLPYLARLGVDAVWVWPLVDLGFFRKTGARDYNDIHRDMGTLEDFTDFAKAAHDLDIKVIIGFGLSATSDEHSWFQKALAGDEKYQDYYVFKKGTPDAPPNNWGFTGSSSAWLWYPEMQAWALRLLGGHRMDLNWDNPDVRAEMCNILEFWQQQGADGFVLGSANYISKANYGNGNATIASLIGIRGYEHFMYGPHLNEYFEDLRTNCVNSKDIMLMGEMKAFGPGLANLVTGNGRQMDMVLDATHLAIAGRVKDEEGRITLQELKDYFCKWIVGIGPKRWMPLILETPEHPRLLSRLAASPVYRAILAKLLGTMMLTLRGTPVLYQGQELGLVNTRFNSPDELRHSVSLRMYAEYKELYGEKEAFARVVKYAPDHARIPMPWSPAPQGGFTGAKPWIRIGDSVDYLNATTQMEDRNSVWAHYQKLIELRKENPCLRYGSFNPVFVNNKRLFCYFRMLEGEKWYVEINISEKAVSRPGRILNNMHLVLSNYDLPSRMLRPYEANVYRCEV